MSKASSTGNFFAVERRCWEAVCGLGMNEAVAYLVLARFSQADNCTTSASVNAIEKHTGIARGRCKAAIETLIKQELLLRTKTASSPQYKILPARYLPFVRDSLSHRAFKAEKEEVLKQDWIWLPNEIVTGAGREIPPVERLRQTGDKMLLRLFIDLYHEQNLRDDGGINRDLYWNLYQREKLSERGQYIVWIFRCPNTYSRERGPIAAHYRDITPAERSAGRNRAVDVSNRLNFLYELGLFEWVPYLFESEDVTGEPIHAYGVDLSDCIEDRLGRAAHDAGFALLSEGYRKRLEEETDFHLAPVPRHMQNVQLIGIARLLYRPKTKLTAAWYADLHEKGARFLAVYLDIETGNLANAA